MNERMRRHGDRGWFLPVLLMGLGLFLLAMGWQEHSRIAALKRGGVKTSAVVVNIEYVAPQRTGGLADYLPVVEWTTPDGRRIVKRAGFGSHDPNAFGIGERLTVYYDPKAPESRYYLPYPGGSWPRWVLDNMALVLGVVFLAGGAAMSWGRRSS